MANKLQEYQQLSADTAVRITRSYLEWTGFLSTISRIYKYPFSEQLLIYAQRPEVTACAEYGFWNQTMRRYIRRGSTGIALIDNSRGKPFLRYVFDVADTGGGENARRPYLWQYRAEHHDAVSSMLESRYGIANHDLAKQLEGVAAHIADEYWNNSQRDILNIVDNSFLEGYDDFNIGAAFRNAVAVSVTYTVMSRCGLEPENYFTLEEFQSIFDFNTVDTVTAMGAAVSQSSEQVLRQIERTVKQYEREKEAERSTNNGKQPDLHTNGGLPDSPI